MNLLVGGIALAIFSGAAIHAEATDFFKTVTVQNSDLSIINAPYFPPPDYMKQIGAVSISGPFSFPTQTLSIGDTLTLTVDFSAPIPIVTDCCADYDYQTFNVQLPHEGAVIAIGILYSIGATFDAADHAVTNESFFYQLLPGPAASHGAEWKITNGAIGLTAIPEPATWAVLLVGLGAVGASMRSRRRIKNATV